MPFSSVFGNIDIPQTDILTYVFGSDSPPSDQPLFIDAENTQLSLSAKQVLQWVKRLNVGLDRLGVKPGEAVMMFSPNHIFVPVAYLSIVGSGRVFTAANPVYTVPEIVHQLKNTEAKTILAHPSLLQSAIAAAEKAGVPKSRIFQFSDTQESPKNGVRDWREMIGSSQEGESWTWKRMSPHEAATTVATVNFSSGTTGLPKGVCVSHHNLIANVEQTIFMKYKGKKFNRHNHPPERWVGFLPLYHAYGQLWTMLMALKLNISVYIMKQFQYEPFLQVIQDFKITHLHVAPPILVMLHKRPETDKYDLSSVQEALCGAAPLSKELQNDVAKRFNMLVYQGWGMTEVTCGALHVPGGFDDASGTVGQLDPNTECKMLDDDGKEVQEGEPGELYIRGPQVCLRYWKNEPATKETICPDGWLKTGDVAVQKKGWFWIVDRKKELIKVNALQVAPAELEAVLLENDDVADAAVVGITLHHEEWPRAYVALKDHAKGKITEKQLQNWMKSRVAKHKQLIGGVQFVDEVPKLASGKIVRKLLKEWAKRDAPRLENTFQARL
ncbi:4-coumarate-CoA ligase [Aulographum hederae CBS 113979]|uniref:4-coumarate-CoA ligase n=1 Tax=Aulographum hederae CBS 113979 TaxID=1176131 RepID=A0A6G1GNQ5_9PEZI|nr:4-coumarate-CoA ligase [Aulographum hederae CBS 113979]